MANIPADLKYTKEHEWAKREGDKVRVIPLHDEDRQIDSPNASLAVSL